MPSKRISGTNDHEQLLGGTPNGWESFWGIDGFDDWIDGGGGDDTINAFDGNDTLLCGFGRDTIYGDDGNDMIVDQWNFNLGSYWNYGNDVVYAGAGHDVVDYRHTLSDRLRKACGGATGSDSSSGCGPERPEAGWPSLAERRSATRLT
jgi:Ca2+-binding RTX toxin-like protein